VNLWALAAFALLIALVRLLQWVAVWRRRRLI
jgi:hypothetical protein